MGEPSAHGAGVQAFLALVRQGSQMVHQPGIPTRPTPQASGPGPCVCGWMGGGPSVWSRARAGRLQGPWPSSGGLSWPKRDRYNSVLEDKGNKLVNMVVDFPRLKKNQEVGKYPQSVSPIENTAESLKTRPTAPCTHTKEGGDLDAATRTAEHVNSAAWLVTLSPGNEFSPSSPFTDRLFSTKTRLNILIGCMRLPHEEEDSIRHGM